MPPIFVTRPFLPPINDVLDNIQAIWETRVLTNGGPLHNRLETELENYLNINNISLFCNATIALLAALKSLGVKGEVITTPYSFVATAHSILWNNLKPVFVDIEANNFNIDPEKIEAAITPKTSAILAVHCYGYPCDVDRIDSIAKKYSLPVIYDAAHAFGVELGGGESLLGRGDLSVLSFHATKVFNTFEGGAIVSNLKANKVKIDQLKNFGIVDELSIVECGINGKLSELHSAIGLAQLPHMSYIHSARQRVDYRYREALSTECSISIPLHPQTGKANYSYFPVLFERNKVWLRDKVYESLKEQGIFTRRYFYPLISSFPMYKGIASGSPDNLPNAVDVANRVLCLPIYPDLSVGDQDIIITALKSALA